MTSSLTGNLSLFKYPRTSHIQGSRLQGDDEQKSCVAYRDLIGKYIVVEEKLDGANSGISFSEGAELLLQSRGHYLHGGGRERQFNVLKRWSSAHENRLLELLSDRYLMFGEFMHKKHSVFYDRLPHWFLEFDIYDRRRECFLSTAARRDLIGDAPVLSVPVLYQGPAPARLNDLLQLIRHSYAKSANWRSAYQHQVSENQQDLQRAWQTVDPSDLMEGLYIKVEDQQHVLARHKWVRADFVQAILAAGQHHSQQAYVANQLAAGVDIYASQLSLGWQELGLTTICG